MEVTVQVIQVVLVVEVEPIQVVHLVVLVLLIKVTMVEMVLVLVPLVKELEVAVEDSGRVAGERLLGGEVVLNLDVAALCHPLHECLSSV